MSHDANPLIDAAKDVISACERRLEVVREIETRARLEYVKAQGVSAEAELRLLLANEKLRDVLAKAEGVDK